MPPVTGHTPINAAPHVTLKIHSSKDAQGLARVREVTAAASSLFTDVGTINQLRQIFFSKILVGFSGK